MKYALIALALLISAPADARGGRCYCGYLIRTERQYIDWRKWHAPQRSAWQNYLALRRTQ